MCMAMYLCMAMYCLLAIVVFVLNGFLVQVCLQMSSCIAGFIDKGLHVHVDLPNWGIGQIGLFVGETTPIDYNASCTREY